MSNASCTLCTQSVQEALKSFWDMKFKIKEIFYNSIKLQFFELSFDFNVFMTT